MTKDWKATIGLTIVAVVFITIGLAGMSTPDPSNLVVKVVAQKGPVPAWVTNLGGKDYLLRGKEDVIEDGGSYEIPGGTAVVDQSVWDRLVSESTANSCSAARESVRSYLGNDLHMNVPIEQETWWKESVVVLGNKIVRAEVDTYCRVALKK